MRTGKSSFSKKGMGFGGMLLVASNAKERRPLSTTQAMELVLHINTSLFETSKSDELTSPNMRFPLISKTREIERLTFARAKKNKIRIQQMLNGGTYMHLILRLPPDKRRARSLYNNFIRALSGEVARLMTGARKSKPASVISRSFSNKFWKQRPYTCILGNNNERLPKLIEHLANLEKSFKRISSDKLSQEKLFAIPINGFPGCGFT